MVELKILEAYTRDVGRGCIRIDYETMDKLGCSTGDHVKVTGKRETVFKVLPLYPSDEKKAICRFDGIGRKNANCEIGSLVSLEKISVPMAEKIVFIPLDAIPPIDERYLTDALESVPVGKGDLVMVPYFGGRLSFKVISTVPEGYVTIVDRKTTSIINTDDNPDSSDIVVKLESELSKLKEKMLADLEHADAGRIIQLCKIYQAEKLKIDEAIKLIRSL